MLDLLKDRKLSGNGLLDIGKLSMVRLLSKQQITVGAQEKKDYQMDSLGKTGIDALNTLVVAVRSAEDHLGYGINLQ